MESSTFVTSKSFAKTIFSSRRRSSRISAPRCSLREEGTAAAADWRSFRAKLVAGEARQGDWWAHRLHEPEKGCLLVATERLDGVHIFERAVVLLLSAGPIGLPTGIILNRPSLMSIKEAGSVAETDVFSGRQLFFGGPVEEDIFLLRNGAAAAESGSVAEVMEGLYYGTKESVQRVGEMVQKGYVAAGDFRFFDGRCRWDGIRELKEEVQAGYWAVAACSAGVLEMDCNQLWEDIVGLVWGKSVR